MKTGFFKIITYWWITWRSRSIEDLVSRLGSPNIIVPEGLPTEEQAKILMKYCSENSIFGVELTTPLFPDATKTYHWFIEGTWQICAIEYGSGKIWAMIYKCGPSKIIGS